ncbi:MAG TPA: NUDIX domain-containing protein [Bacteroidales bacterium]|nr:NUDIX domain-containing protein [Bacteroidales bacterium]
MPKQSAGILLYRIKDSKPEFFLVHPGGPFWAKKDAGAWSIPKGEFSDDEKPVDAAIREFSEETGKEIGGDFIELKPVKQKGGKTVYCFAIEKDIDTKGIRSNTFELEWPPRSGRKQAFPEVDRTGWFDAGTAKIKILESQVPLIEELLAKLKF